MDTTQEHIIDLDKLEIGKYSFDFRLNNDYFTAIEKTELLGGNVAVKAVLDLRNSDYSLDMQVNGVVQVTCDRCLDSMDIEVNANDRFDSEEEEHSVNLNWLAYELIVINLPLVHSHQEGGCNPQMAALLQNHLCCTAEEPEIL
ncbi:MAG: DUF177 domain-containing protein [Paludibacteraceae bacterium]|nr:DUF177 domain-containing protein [Paludibacteraceae bacterium]